jgi:hypothetical protein
MSNKDAIRLMLKQILQTLLYYQVNINEVLTTEEAEDWGQERLGELDELLEGLTSVDLPLCYGCSEMDEPPHRFEGKYDNCPCCGNTIGFKNEILNLIQTTIRLVEKNPDDFALQLQLTSLMQKYIEDGE